jgi:hypothetical protein
MVSEPITSGHHVSRIALHHYALKSLQVSLRTRKGESV